MTLEEIFRADEASPPPPTMPLITAELTEAELTAAGIRLDESRWMPSSIKGIYQRVDPARPEMKQRRHVHLALKKHLSAPGKQVSWNDDATRHDRHNFNDKLGARADVRDIARIALGLPDETLLEHKDTSSLTIGKLASSRLVESMGEALTEPGSVRLISSAAASL